VSKRTTAGEAGKDLGSSSSDPDGQTTDVSRSHRFPELVRHRVERTLTSRYAPPGTPIARIEEKSKSLGLRAWKVAKRWPSVAALCGGAAMLVVADAIGVGEIVLAIGAGYAIYEVLAKNVPLPEAIREAAHIAGSAAE
jgi:hypothetical protein